jgi:hypothetical protein
VGFILSFKAQRRCIIQVFQFGPLPSSRLQKRVNNNAYLWQDVLWVVYLIGLRGGEITGKYIECFHLIKPERQLRYIISIYYLFYFLSGQGDSQGKCEGGLRMGE